MTNRDLIRNGFTDSFDLRSEEFINRHRRLRGLPPNDEAAMQDYNASVAPIIAAEVRRSASINEAMQTMNRFNGQQLAESNSAPSVPQARAMPSVSPASTEKSISERWAYQAMEESDGTMPRMQALTQWPQFRALEKQKQLQILANLIPEGTEQHRQFMAKNFTKDELGKPFANYSEWHETKTKAGLATIAARKKDSNDSLNFYQTLVQKGELTFQDGQPKIEKQIPADPTDVFSVAKKDFVDPTPEQYNEIMFHVRNNPRLFPTARLRPKFENNMESAEDLRSVSGDPKATVPRYDMYGGQQATVPRRNNMIPKGMGDEVLGDTLYDMYGRIKPAISSIAKLFSAPNVQSYDPLMLNQGQQTTQTAPQYDGRMSPSQYDSQYDGTMVRDRMSPSQYDSQYDGTMVRPYMGANQVEMMQNVAIRNRLQALGY